MTTDVSPSPTTGAGPAAGVTARRRTSPALLAAVGLYAAAAGHVIAALVHLSTAGASPRSSSSPRPCRSPSPGASAAARPLPAS